MAGVGDSPLVGIRGARRSCFGDLLILTWWTAGWALDKRPGAIKWQTGRSSQRLRDAYDLRDRARNRSAGGGVLRPTALVVLYPGDSDRLWSGSVKTQYKITRATRTSARRQAVPVHALTTSAVCALIDVSACRPRIVWQTRC